MLARSCDITDISSSHLDTHGVMSYRGLKDRNMGVLPGLKAETERAI